MEEMMTQLDSTETRTVQIRLPVVIEARLQEKAKQVGLSLVTYLEELAEQDSVADPMPELLEEAIRRTTSRTTEQVLADREAILKTARRARPLPPGKTLADVVAGTWPGDESDDEIRMQLERLS